MSGAFGLEVVKVETLSPPDPDKINELMGPNQTPNTGPQISVEQSEGDPLFSESDLHGDNVQIPYNFSTRKRGLSWSDMETRSLLEVWTERNSLFDGDELCSANGQVYRTIASEMADRGYQKTAIQCKTRMKTLKRAYKHCRMLLRTRGKVKRLCRFYKEIDFIVRHTANKKKLGLKGGANIEPPLVTDESKPAANGSWGDSLSKANGPEGEKFNPSIPLLECEVIENDLSDEIEISDDDDEEEPEEDEEGVAIATTTDGKTTTLSTTTSLVSLPSENRPVEAKLEAFSLNSVDSRWLNVIALDDSANSSNLNISPNNRNVLIELGEISKPNQSSQVTCSRSTFPIPETSGVFLPEKDPILHSNNSAKGFSLEPSINQREISIVKSHGSLPESLSKELWSGNQQGTRNILHKQELTPFSKQNENRIVISGNNCEMFQTQRHLPILPQSHPSSLELNQMAPSQTTLEKKVDLNTLTSSSSASYINPSVPTAPPPVPMEILVPDKDGTRGGDLEGDLIRKHKLTTELDRFGDTLKSVVDGFTRSLETLHSKQFQSESLRLELEMKKLEVERERQALEREKMNNDVQRHREDRKHQFEMLKMILEHVSSNSKDIAGLDPQNTSQLLQSINQKI